jgi:tRNA pseudouridine55 synthase
MDPLNTRVFNLLEGEVLLIDKPIEWSSTDVVSKIRKSSKFKKIGHAGTLDPLASGLLILCTGKMTKKISNYQDLEKEYTGTMILGKTTPSCDRETEVDSETDICDVTDQLIQDTTKKFIGTIKQIPPVFSAIKVGGERLYKKARRGEEVAILPREVEVAEFEITSIDLPQVHFKVVCSKGTYIRSLVRDFGIALCCGAYMSSLRRTRIGTFHVDEAYNIQDLALLVKKKK